jgi:hypothetical protein
LEEKAIIYGRLKRHEEALAIYSTVLMDFQAADRHCSHYYQPHGDDKLARNVRINGSLVFPITLPPLA